ncbi:hypothetical protein AGR4A_Lc130268 [Agrobacterium tumefaciens str. B6]|uniref:Uncharacterized protein n=1 Tax=Agrobacterium tumefaciens str. B6 TaxID=1183423 RepID=A0A822V5U3_AGRTU|nr:hypothetical protein AGR4A_Lc130268 [Agrobacterium tumefaciens str. B6]
MEATLREVDRKDMHLCHLLSLRERHHGARQASYAYAGQRGHPPHQFSLHHAERARVLHRLSRFQRFFLLALRTQLRYGPRKGW